MPIPDAMQLFLACGSMHLTNFDIGIILLLLATIASLPVLAVANIFLAAKVHRQRFPLHLGLFAAYAVPGLIWWHQHDVWSFEIQIVCCALIPNVIVAQFGFLFFKAWQHWRLRRSRRAAVRTPPVGESRRAELRCVACNGQIEAGVYLCPECGWTQPVMVARA